MIVSKSVGYLLPLWILLAGIHCRLETIALGIRCVLPYSLFVKLLRHPPGPMADMIQLAWKTFCNTRKELENEKNYVQMQIKTSGRKDEEYQSPSSVTPCRMQTAMATCPSLFSMLEAVPLYGSPISLLWPFCGMAFGALANRCFRFGLSPEIKVRLFRFGGPVAVVATGVFLTSTVASVPETNRSRFTAKWPWMDEDAVADLDPVFEWFLDSRVVNNPEGKPKWVGGVFSKLKTGNEDVNLMADKLWKIKVRVGCN